MSILVFHDDEGDVVAVESAAITIVRVGRSSETSRLFTLISTPGSTVAVCESAEDVLAAWSAARTSGPSSGDTGFHGWPGWPVNWLEPHPSIVKPSGPAPWAAKTGGKP